MSEQPVRVLPRSLMRLTRAQEGIVTCLAVWDVVRSAWNWVESRNNRRDTITLRFIEGSREHGWLLAWLLTLPEAGKANEFHARYRNKTEDLRRYRPCPSPEAIACQSGEIPPKGAWALVPRQTLEFLFRGMKVRLGVTEAPAASTMMLLDKNSFLLDSYVDLICVTRDRSQVQTLLDEIAAEGMRGDYKRRVPGVFCRARWGAGWSRVRDVPTTRVPVLPGDMLDELERDVRWFRSAAEWYAGVGVPHRRGYLFHGVPGSGKTTTAIALASRLDLDIYVIPLADITDDGLQEAIVQFQSDGLFLLEDLDCVAATLDRDAEKKNATETKLTLQGLLNVIDGAATPDGRLIIGTTNYKDRIDKALLRPGRIDRQFEFGNATYEQICELCSRFGLNGESKVLAGVWHNEGLSMAVVQERLIERVGLGKETRA